MTASEHGPEHPTPSGPETSPEDDLAALRDGEAALLATAEKLDAAELTEPSLLPGWSRGHVLTHLARNADALVNVLEGRPMYASAEARDHDIEVGAARPLAAHLDDLRTSAARLDRAFAGYGGERWENLLELRNGVTDRAAALPFRRRVEVELHHYDLDAGRELADLPAGFAERAVGYLARRFTGNPEVPATELRAADGRTWHTGRAFNPEDPAGDGTPAPPVVVTGSTAALAGWLAGRTTGGGLTADGGTLPVLPPL
ncbi:maleylpyruvate isomerase family mycothiol-dependent enzyme [Streptomyces sp. TRM 70351]|uniref:maleylpyruvate isomerase family mycothiol-dependent enzyme n=1 Tax=Streptomyces sp. TRM 70351 TaxID=3116552 RepID=UPI002E7B0EEC|nr:maleylpyruvate isomerase family mycothiol-dependent enzyme [Streptomyces sp. TRM 70351]MEE1930547.1 maleylpyruvate isomerase family mycothiol-dependent enzyme [Streptomyces sp. TRM 70351]